MARIKAPKWYQRLGDVPGIGYVSPPSVNREQLPGHDARPKAQTWNSYGIEEPHKELWWPSLYGANGEAILPNVSPQERQWTTASPASQRSSRNWRRTEHGQPPRSARHILQEMFEILELPGKLYDYHSAIFHCCNALWGCRREAPWVALTLEKLCFLDIRLLETFPYFRHELFPDLGNGENVPLRYPAFDTLVRLYESEGYLLEVMEVAERAKRMGQNEDLVEQLRERVDALRAEGELAGAP